jgi:hypothetical protein
MRMGDHELVDRTKMVELTRDGSRPPHYHGFDKDRRRQDRPEFSRNRRMHDKAKATPLVALIDEIHAEYLSRDGHQNSGN